MSILQKSKFIVILVVLTMIIVPNIAFAQFQLIPNCALGKYNPERNIYEQDKAPDLNCVEQILVNIAQIILGISGAIALLMFIYGGFLWLTAAGSSSKVQQGTKIMVGTVIGLVIIFAANLAITAVKNVLTGAGLGAPQTQSETPSAAETPTIPEMGCCGANTPSTKADCSVNWTPGSCSGSYSAMGCCSYNDPALGGLNCADTDQSSCEKVPGAYEGTFYTGKTCKRTPNVFCE